MCFLFDLIKALNVFITATKKQLLELIFYQQCPSTQRHNVLKGVWLAHIYAQEVLHEKDQRWNESIMTQIYHNENM